MDLARAALRSGRPGAAERILRGAVKTDPGAVAAWRALGAVSERLGLWAQAAKAHGRVFALEPHQADGGLALARAQAILGRTAQALSTWRAVARIAEHRAPALVRIAILAPDAITEDELAFLQTAAGDDVYDDETAIALPFAVGAALEARGEHETAFAAFAEGNRRKRASLTGAWAPAASAAAHARSARLVMDTFTPALLASHAGGGCHSDAPIFVVGFPRSGSSLIEQILASHPSIRALGESGVIGSALDRAWRSGIAGADYRVLGEACLAAERAAGWRGAPRFVDKTLENYLHVGAIALMFPRAVIIQSVRDPVEACLSCWRQLFAADAETLYDLADIAAEFRRYSEMMAHWRTVLPGRVVQVSHEALIAEPQAQVRRLVVEVCGLSWDPACLQFFATRRAVRTASAVQVRRPLFRPRRRRRLWSAHITPLLSALGEFAAER